MKKVKFSLKDMTLDSDRIISREELKAIVGGDFYQCGSQGAGATCPNGMCCGSFGFCGTGPDYCGAGCQSQCDGEGGPGGGGGCTVSLTCPGVGAGEISCSGSTCNSYPAELKVQCDSKPEVYCYS
jgi:hypothetical protein